MNTCTTTVNLWGTKLITDPKFFQAAVSVIPTLLIAFAFTSKFLEIRATEPTKVLARSTTGHSASPDIESEPEVVPEPVVVIGVSGLQGIKAAAIVVFAAVTLEVVNLLSLAFENYQPVIIWIDMLAITALVLLIGLKAIEPMIQNVPLEEGETQEKRQKFANRLVISAMAVVMGSAFVTAVLMGLAKVLHW